MPASDAALPHVFRSCLRRVRRAEPLDHLARLFKPGQATPKDYYAELPIEVKLTGSFHDIGAFASDVAHLSRIVTLNNLNITTTKDNLLTLEVIAKTFRYLDPEEVASQKKAQKGAKK